MNLSHVGWRIYRWFLDLLSPPQCVHCGRVEVWICKRCVSALPLISVETCWRCGRPVAEPGLCSICERNPLQVNPVRSSVLFEGEIRDLIHALKYRGAASVAQALAPHMAASWRRYDMDADLLIPVPLHPQREAKRGYNQAYLLAAALSPHIDCPVAPHVLKRVRNTTSQTQLNLEERRQNVTGAFAVATGLDLKGYKVTLIDDVATTGSTLDACAKMLLQANAEKVSAFTLARAP